MFTFYRVDYKTWGIAAGETTYRIDHDNGMFRLVSYPTYGPSPEEELGHHDTLRKARRAAYTDATGFDIEGAISEFDALEPGDQMLIYGDTSMRSRLEHRARKNHWKIHSQLKGNDLTIWRDMDTTKYDPMGDWIYEDLEVVQTTTGARDEQVSWRVIKGIHLDGTPDGITYLVRRHGNAVGYELMEFSWMDWQAGKPTHFRPRGRMPIDRVIYTSWFEVQRHVIRSRLLWRKTLHKELRTLWPGVSLVAPYQKELSSQLKMSAFRLKRKFKSKRIEGGQAVEIWALDAPPV